MESESEAPFIEKGLDLLLESFAEFSQHHKASLRLLWRGKYNLTLHRKIKELDLENRVAICYSIKSTRKRDENEVFYSSCFRHKNPKKMAFSLAVFTFNSQIELIWTAVLS